MINLDDELINPLNNILMIIVDATYHENDSGRLYQRIDSEIRKIVEILEQRKIITKRK